VVLVLYWLGFGSLILPIRAVFSICFAVVREARPSSFYYRSFSFCTCLISGAFRPLARSLSLQVWVFGLSILVYQDGALKVCRKTRLFILLKMIILYY
jgi:hypothetical protein